MNTSDFLISNIYRSINHKIAIEPIVREAKCIRIICPFLSQEMFKWLFEVKSHDCKIELITDVTKKGIATGFHSPDLLKFIFDNGASVYFKRGGLHSKVYWFDDSHILITSANFTNSGMEQNFEIGVLFEKARAPVLAKEVDFSAIKERIRNLWEDLRVRAEVFDENTYEEMKKIEKETLGIREQLGKYNEPERGGYVVRPHDCQNAAQIDIELQAANLFKGFKEEDWSPFDHNLPFNQENLEKVKSNLTIEIQPILKKFYEQLRHSRDLEVKLGNLDRGYSLNRWVKNYFPNYRYLWLCRSRVGKNPIKHIGEPSYILGMGMKDGEKWFEVRTGVEELNENKITEFGRNFIKNMNADIDLTLKKMHELGKGWVLTHENAGGTFPSEISTERMEKETLKQLLSHYLGGDKIADIHIRKRYSMSIGEDVRLLTSNKIIDEIAKDLNSLHYFFEVAHKGKE